MKRSPEKDIHKLELLIPYDAEKDALRLTGKEMQSFTKIVMKLPAERSDIMVKWLLRATTIKMRRGFYILRQMRLGLAFCRAL